MVADCGICSVRTDKDVTGVSGSVGTVDGHALLVLVEGHHPLAHVQSFFGHLAQEKAVKDGACYDIFATAGAIRGSEEGVSELVGHYEIVCDASF